MSRSKSQKAEISDASGAPVVSDAGRVRHVSGSILPSNEPRILTPVETPFGMLQVRVIEELDTHGLFHRHTNGESLLATHGNGYSCFNLLEKMVARDNDAVTRQAQYILDCGGTTRNVQHIRNVFCCQHDTALASSREVRS